MITITLKRKVRSDGTLGYIIKSFEMLPASKLPDIYFDREVKCFADYDHGKTIKVYKEHDIIEEYSIGSFLTKDDVNDLINTIKLCGEELKECNEKLKNLRKIWNGIETIEI